jgi:hypothetical protein
MQFMNRAPASFGALAHPLFAATCSESLEIARRVIVLGCAAALIMAGKALPF